MLLDSIPADPKHAVVRQQVESVQFGLYTDEDVRARSVVEVTSPLAFDGLGTALVRGLYDARMGPVGPNDAPCVTCARVYAHCPGHAGAVELSVPVHHPLLVGLLVRLLRAKCWSCHKFRMAEMPLRILETKLWLVARGRLGQALELDQVLQGDSTHIEQVLQDTTCHQEDTQSPYTTTCFDKEYIRQLQKEFWSHCVGSKSCPHCGAHSPKIRHDGFTKLFQAPLSATSARINAAEDIVLQSALGDENDNDEDNDDAGETLEHDSTTPAKITPKDKFLHTLEVEAQVHKTWQHHPALCQYIFGPAPTMFFIRAVPVPPNRFRPPMVLGNLTVENAQNLCFNQMLVLNDKIRTLLSQQQEQHDEDTTETQQQQQQRQALALSTWIELQTVVNRHFDSSKDPSGSSQTNGIRQLLEKKEGLFRKHFMGKRVDYACRSVISPDPYVGTNEIGIPQHFCQVLTFPTPVSDLTIQHLRNLVRRGPREYPGAVWVQYPDGRRVDLDKMDATQRGGLAARLRVGTIVGRQIHNGDVMLVNRQPTLHKPGIMAHRVRVLHNPTQKTIRMHYANCNTYNADFDGDEMNCHLPQNYLAVAEAKYIAATDLQYIVPTDATPLRGLIQDHVDAGVKLTCKDSFLEKWEYQQLLFNALASLPGLEVIRLRAEIELLPPAILKPKPLWTGKQVVSTLLNHLRQGNDEDDVVDRMEPMPGISVERKAKLSAAGFGEEEKEHLVLIRDGELLRGVLDKAAFGSTEFSLVHAVYEAYGPSKAGLLLNALGRMLTAYLQYYAGHSCRMEDLILTKEADNERHRLIQRAYNIGSRAAKAWADSEGGKVEIESVADKEGCENALKPVESASAAAKIGQLLSGNDGKANFAALDGYMQSQLNPLASEIIKTCLPKGLAVPFPANTFGLMVSTGAKGSMVNQSQVSCALGQQALEGRRVPRLASGRTLPSFAPYDPSPRADGFIMDRFLTGIRPQEYYFHCMAGREGLVDTAVKTSRSGYLQRCLVKHLEELKVCYDSTVRNGEGGVIQFLYGEDGLDPTKAAFLDCSSTTFQYIARNHRSLTRRNHALPNATLLTAAKDDRRVKELKRRDTDLLTEGSFVLARRLRVGSRWVRGAFCLGWFDATIVSVHGDGTFDIKYSNDGKFAENVPLDVNLGRCGGTTTVAACSVCPLIKPGAPDPVLAGGSREDGIHRFGSSGKCISERVAGTAMSAIKRDSRVKEAMKANAISSKHMDHLIAAKYGAAMCHPGEAVGSIAAQSIGEPSTQMTLNTFHLAGAGANVTLGIPRLREIIMTASRVLKTPTMSVPLNEDVTDRQALRLTRYFTKLTLNELISSRNGIVVNETLFQGSAGNWERAYHVTLRFHPSERIREAFGLTLDDIARVIASSFQAKIADIMKRELRRSSQEGDVASFEVQGGNTSDYVPDDAEDNEEPQTPQHSRDRRRDDEHDDLEEEDDGDDEAVGEEDGVNAARFGRMEEVDGYEDDDEIQADEAEEDDSGYSEEQEQQSAGEPTEEDEPFRAVANMSDQPKLDRRHNAIHLAALRVDPAARPLLIVGLVERAASVTLVRSRPRIEKGFVNDEDGRGRCLQTAGVNFQEIWKLESVNHDLLASNDIWAIRCAYGVEAARNNIVEQIKGVFKPYGISVDHRHLTLIADFMTFDGGFKPMNRGGMSDISSPFLQMSFETTANFMIEAALQGRSEPLMSPSANIVVGRPVRHGTGAFDVRASHP